MDDNKLYPKEFIRKIYIGNVGQLVDMKYYYICFGLIGIGIEFLGKCIVFEKNKTWEDRHHGKNIDNFNDAIKELMPDYSQFLDAPIYLADNLRNGMSHAFRPKGKIEFSHIDEAKDKKWTHLNVNEKGRLVLICELLFADFKNACENVVNRIELEKFPKGDKIYLPFLEV